MTQKTIQVFSNGTYNKPQKNPSNKTKVYNIENIWSIDILDLTDYGLEDNRNCR